MFIVPPIHRVIFTNTDMRRGSAIVRQIVNRIRRANQKLSSTNLQHATMTF